MDKVRRNKNAQKPELDSQYANFKASPQSPMIEKEDNLDAITPHDQSPVIKSEPTKNHGRWKKLKETTTSEWITAFATVMIMLATSAYSLIALKQWRVMENQTVAAFQQLSTAKGSIRIANEALADARQSGADQSARAERLTKSNEIIAQATIKSVENSKQVAKQSLDATIDNFHLDQRAWVGKTNISLPPYVEGDKKVYIKEGQKVLTTVTIANYGKTPAHNLKNSYSYQILKPSDDPCKTIIVADNYGTNTVIYPGMKLLLLIPEIPVAGVINKTDILNITNGNVTFYITGVISYSDIFNMPHTSRYCFRLQPNLTMFDDCSTCNDSN